MAVFIIISQLFSSFRSNQKHNRIAKIIVTIMELNLSLFDTNLIQLYKCVSLATLLRVFFSGTPIVRIIV